MKKTWKVALISTLPVMTGYLVLGFGFGSESFMIPAMLIIALLLVQVVF